MKFALFAEKAAAAQPIDLAQLAKLKKWWLDHDASFGHWRSSSLKRGWRQRTARAGAIAAKAGAVAHSGVWNVQRGAK
jgi:hypothetical protein